MALHEFQYHQTAHRTLSILGVTGSIGTQALDVLRRHSDRFRLQWITTQYRIEELEQIIREFQPQGVVIADESAYQTFKQQTSFTGRIECGAEALCMAASDSANDIVLSSLVGFAGVLPTYHALQQGITIALANKETLVSAGEVMSALAKKKSVNILAVDSEHSAMLQCMIGESMSQVEKLMLTASGGPFRTTSKELLSAMTASDALKHPNWSMGNKITIDSATMMNKGFEVIEAHWLFDIAPENIEVVVHPQSIIHSMVQFVDGSVKAQMGLPDMKIPIQYALSYPERWHADFPRMNFATMHTLHNLTFEQPDTERFPCLSLAFSAMQAGGIVPAVLNAANEIAVAEFLQNRIRFTDIPILIEETINVAEQCSTPSLDDICQADATARTIARRFAEKISHTLLHV